jgi:Uma2 family endonuclease
MAASTAFPVSIEWTVADMIEHMGGIPAKRIRMHPSPGTATLKDVLEVEARTGRSCELVDGVLVEKTMGYFESLVAVEIAYLMKAYLEPRGLGIVLGADGTLRILPEQVRIPDVCFISWDHFPNRELPKEPIPSLAPDLAVEVLSEGNTEGEMQRKLRDYFSAGVRLVWYIDPRARTAKSYTSPEQCVLVGEDQGLSGADVLPGFELSLSELFARASGRRSV